MRKIVLQRKNAGGGWRGRAAVALAFAVGCVGLGFNVQNEFDGVGGNVAFATEYYLDSAGGDDANDGKTPETAWRSLERLDKAALEPGDVVRFRRDRVWRGTLRPKSGSEGKPIVYSDYGDGVKPRILQSVDLSSPEFWTKIDDPSRSIWATAPDEIVDLPANGVSLEDFGKTGAVGNIGDVGDFGTTGAVGNIGEDAQDGGNYLNNENVEGGSGVPVEVARFADGGWGVYSEVDAKATSEKATFDDLDGAAGYSLKCEKSGTKKTYLQWTAQDFPTRAGRTLAWRFRARSSVPFAVDASVASFMMAGKPWTGYGDVGCDRLEFGPEWREYELIVSSKVDAEDARLTFFFGGAIPDGARFDFVPGTARSVERRSVGLNDDVGNLILTRWQNGDAASTPATLEFLDPETKAATKRFLPTADEREFAGFKRWSLDELKAANDFWFDLATKRLYVLSDENPGVAFEGIEAPLRTNTCVCNANDVVVENIAFSHTAAHGVSLNGAKRCVIRNCDFDWIGGGDLYREGGAGRRTRFGNGVEFWESSEDCVVEFCRFSRIYDVAVTTQGPEKAVSRNLTIRDNTMFDCEQAFEIWFTHPETVVENLVFERNLCVDMGNCWGHAQRPNPRATPLLGYGLDAKKVDVIIRKNVFCGTVQHFVWFYHKRIGEHRIDDNVYWTPDEDVLPREEGDKFFWYDAKNPQSLTFDEYRKATGHDKTSRWVEPKFRNRDANDFELLNRDELAAGPRSQR
ncbi:MAG: right-handed parallel beta-helix repeat-containing protein [Thermoguttaceae bacterium]|nr:right-handed parallel beta-helix repeat-containing protein [Thermoguttaceae bacterium]